jgi:hypothetical protein
MGDRRSAYRILVGRPEVKRHLVYLGVDGSIIFKLIVKKRMGRHGLISLKIGTGGGLL